MDMKAELTLNALLPALLAALLTLASAVSAARQ